MKKVTLWLLVFTLVALIGCGNRSAENTQRSEQVVPKTEVAKSVEAAQDKEIVKKEVKVVDEEILKRDRFDEIRTDLIERGLIDESTPVYGFGERIVIDRDPPPNIYTGNIPGDYRGKEYYIAISSLSSKRFMVGFNVVGTRKNLVIDDRNLEFGVLVDDEVISFNSFISLVSMTIDNKPSMRYNLESNNQRVMDDVRESDHVVLFFTIFGKEEVIIILDLDIEKRG